MNKELLITLIKKDIEELKALTGGFEQMDVIPSVLLTLSVDKASQLQSNLLSLGRLDYKTDDKMSQESVAPKVVAEKLAMDKESAPVLVNEISIEPEVKLTDVDVMGVESVETNKLSDENALTETGEPATPVEDVEMSEFTSEELSSEETEGDGYQPVVDDADAVSLFSEKLDVPCGCVEKDEENEKNVVDDEPVAANSEPVAGEVVVNNANDVVEEDRELVASENEAVMPEDETIKNEAEIVQEKDEDEMAAELSDEESEEPEEDDEAEDEEEDDEETADAMEQEDEEEATAFDLSSTDYVLASDVELKEAAHLAHSINELPTSHQEDEDRPTANADVAVTRVADVINKTESLGQSLSSDRDNSVNGSLLHKKISDLKSAITIVDRFRFQRELFGGDGEKMMKTISDLNQMSDFMKADAYLKKHFNWSDDNSCVADFMMLLHRRF